MQYTLRIVQKYPSASAEAFLRLEAEFKQLELRSPGFPQGRRYMLVSETEADNIFVWESDFASIEDVQNALKTMAEDPSHSELFENQRPYITESRTEIYELLDL